MCGPTLTSFMHMTLARDNILGLAGSCFGKNLRTRSQLFLRKETNMKSTRWLSCQRYGIKGVPCEVLCRVSPVNTRCRSSKNFGGAATLQQGFHDMLLVCKETLFRPSRVAASIK